MKTAIFLGAGASKADGAPLQYELFKEYFRSKRPQQIRESTIPRTISAFFKDVFGLTVDKKTLDSTVFPSFEEALGMVDLAEARHETLRGYSNCHDAEPSERLSIVRSYLVFLMADIIHKELQISSVHHRKLVRKLGNSNLLKETAFISTNYDILVDNALLHTTGKDPDYGTDISQAGRSGGNHMGGSGSRVPLFKLHGSLNWIFCPVCNRLDYTPRRKVAVTLMNDLKQAKCHICRTVYSPLIVPPTFFKDFTNAFLNMVWNKAERTLSDVNRLIFCGYSFPDADMHVKYLLKRIQTNRQKRTKLRFAVVNNHPGKTVGMIKQERERFARFLGKSAIKYTDLSFEEFAANPAKVIST